MAATLGFPFTAAQWKELERQAMIYKYMVASVPVPYELLLPIIQNLPPSNSPFGRYSRKQDVEPGRCKRTDGKKWRCSKDVAPNQKYCHRHMHRGRPRSRKHVEPTPSSPLLNNNTPTPLPKSPPQPPFFPYNMHSKTLNPNTGGLDCNMEGGHEQQWLQIMQTSCSIFNSDFGEEQPSSFTEFGTPTRDFISAAKDSSVCPSVNLSSSALDLSMAMGLGLGLGNHELGEIDTAGGPLAEVLRPSSVPVVGSNPTSPYPTDSISPPPTAMSSPSGVLHITMLSLSDGSVCNSPTTDVGAFQWFT